jgi:hypothetical protein
MRCPSAKRLIEEFKITPEAADHVRKLAALADDGDKLEAYIAEHCPTTHAYARSGHIDPFRTKIWRVTMALHAIDILIDGHGVEGLGPGRSGDYAPPFEYVNMGDPYVATLIYRRDTDNLYIGNWGAIAERHPNRSRGGSS